MAAPRFEVIKDEDETPERDDAQAPDQTAQFAVILNRLLGLTTLAQRFAVALSDLFSLLTVATVFCLALMIIPYEPSTYQLAGLGGYAIFVVATNIIVRRR